MQRLYEPLLKKHFSENNQMGFLAGPRQSGKTTIAKEWLFSEKRSSGLYLNWDNLDDRALLGKGPAAMAEQLGLHALSRQKATLVLDEIHKYNRWKTLVKGFYDTYSSACQITVTGSAKLDVYQKGGDSLMGRYFIYRVHPFSVGECIRPLLRNSPLLPPVPIDDDRWEALWQFGGFPEPMLKQNQRFYNQWKRLRSQQLFREDIRDLTRVQEIGQLELLGTLLEEQSSQLITYHHLSNQVRVTSDTIRRWLSILESVYFCFRITPWTRSVTRSLLKEPKLYLWDWAGIGDDGQRAENFIASHLLKAVHLWTDMGFGTFGLHFIRDKEQREVDFLVSKDNSPWFLVEVKKSDTQLSSALIHFHEKLKTQHAFQVVIDKDYVDVDCFSKSHPIVVPAKTFLSQLL